MTRRLPPALLLAAAAAGVVPGCVARDADAQACHGGITKGAFAIKGMPSAYLAGAGGDINGDRLTIRHNSGYSVLSSCEKEWKPEAIAQFKLLGRAVSFTIDLSKVGCACNVGLYLVASPARDIHGEYSKGSHSHPYYCDANKVGGQWCPEIDVMEANNHAFQSTAHSCDKPTHGHYSQCDRVGCAQNTRTVDGAYGPGREHDIDTTHPFEVHTEFIEEGGRLAGMRTILVQSSRRVVLSHASCDAGYLAKLTDAMAEGMSMSISYWGQAATTMAWLDAPPCGGESCAGPRAGHAVFSNITISELGGAGARSDDGDGGAAGGAVGDDEDEVWVSNPWEPWQCHHYVGNQQETRWCQRAGFEGGFEYKYTGGEVDLCGPCWCCMRPARRRGGGGGAAATSTAAPTWISDAPAGHAPAPAWRPPTTTEAVTTKAPSMIKGELMISGVDSAYLAGTGGSVAGDAITIHHNAGFTIFTDKAKTWEPDNIEEFKLLGKVISYRVDLSKVGCACNLAFYLIAMPARDMQGQPNAGTDRQGQPPYYCDANQVGGQWCPEIDIMEANSHAFQATLHRCDAPVDKHYSFCDRGGCEQTTRTRDGAYGPGSEYTIDTTRPFDVDTEFLNNDGELSGMRTTLRQERRQEVMEHRNCNKAYLAKLSDAMASGMSLRITYWGGEAQTMAWMDVPPCGGGACRGSNAGRAIISDIQIKPGGAVDQELVWVVWDPKDKLFGKIVPRQVVTDHETFASLDKEGIAIANWKGAQHFLRQMPRSEVAARLKEAKGSKLSGGSSDLISADCDDPESPCEVSVRGEGSSLQAFMKKYSALAVSLPSAGWWPAQLALFLALALLAGAGASLVTRRLVRGPRSGAAALAVPRAEPGSPLRAGAAGPRPWPPSSPPATTRMAFSSSEGPSPLRRARSGGMLATPPRVSSRHELLSLLEACAE